MKLFRDFGWCMQEAKCNLSLERQVVLLGFLLDTQALTIDVTHPKGAAGASAPRVLARGPVGKIQSNQLAFGLVCRLCSRYLQLAILGAAQSSY
jgi:hypothetical protein